jgi:hypothetical protein
VTMTLNNYILLTRTACNFLAVPNINMSLRWARERFNRPNLERNPIKYTVKHGKRIREASAHHAKAKAKNPLRIGRVVSKKANPAKIQAENLVDFSLQPTLSVKRLIFWTERPS